MFERPDAYGVPAAPNASVVRGTITSAGPAPGGEGRVWELKVEETDDVGEMRNFARTRVGEEISVLVPPGEAKGLKKGDRVEAHLSYEGDERGGTFLLKEKGARKL
jgi:hypothetical protein